MTNFDHFISLEEVIKIIKTSEYADLAQTRFITLRAPVISDDLFPQREYDAQYVFGGSEDREEHILVDAVTGTINVLEKYEDVPFTAADLLRYMNRKDRQEKLVRKYSL